MSWTVACFCGTFYSAPPDRCPACGEELPVHARPEVEHASRENPGAPVLALASTPRRVAGARS